MGTPKQLLPFQNTPMSRIAVRALREGIQRHAARQTQAIAGEKSLPVVLLGDGPVPDSLQDMVRLADVPGLAGPIAGLLAAHRWAPHVSWILAACDHPWLSDDDILWLLDQRRPGVWAVIPRQPDGSPCPTMALYEPQSLVVLERYLLANGPDKIRIAQLVDHERTLTKTRSTRGIVNVNTPEDLMFEEAVARTDLTTKTELNIFQQALLGSTNFACTPNEENNDQF